MHFFKSCSNEDHYSDNQCTKRSLKVKKKKRSTAKQKNNPLIKTSTTLKSDISLTLVIKNG